MLLGILGSVAYGAKYYYDTTQATIATLRENNAQLEVAVDTAQASVEALQGDIVKMASLNRTLQQDLQKAEAYGDELRGKLSKLNLVVEALKDSKVLEGKMNGATANLWRDFMGKTGNTNEFPLPSWLQPVDNAGTTDQNSNQDRENSNTDSSTPEATPAQ